MSTFEDIYPYLPGEIVSLAKGFVGKNVTELRLCRNKPVLISTDGITTLLYDRLGNKVVFTNRMMDFTVDKLTGGSLYSVNQYIKDGFVTLRGGHRVGICGTAVTKDENISHIKHISALCFRVAREVKGCAVSLKEELLSGDSMCNLLITSPPGCGKTTVLRDLCRLIANGELPIGIRRVGIADERGEIAASAFGEPTFDVGVASFVCDGYPKSTAMMSMLRSMCPDVIATDEIGTKADFAGIESAIRCGVSIIATAHSGGMADLKRRFGELLRSFDKIICLKDRGKVSRIFRRMSNDY